MTTEFVARARVPLADPEAVIAALCEHMAEHGGRAETRADGHMVHFGNGRAWFTREGDAALVRVAADSREQLYYLRSTVASHLLELAGDASPDIRWQGDGGDLERPPNFRVLRVVAARDITPRMRRLTLAGDVARYATLEALHVKVLIQPPGRSAPQWPSVGPNGLLHWEDPANRPLTRTYTIRTVDVAAGTVDIDFVLHAHAGPGSAFAQAARPGDEIGVIGPGGGGLVAADWYLFIGDETALPAIARMLTELPPAAHGRALIEVADPGEIQPLERSAAIEVQWLCRDGAAPGTTRLLVDAVRDTALPDDGSTVHVWAGCEFQAFREIRDHLRNQRGLPRRNHLVVAYWRLGDSDDQDTAHGDRE